MGRNPFPGEHGRHRESWRWDAWLVSGRCIFRLLCDLEQVTQCWLWPSTCKRRGNITAPTYLEMRSKCQEVDAAGDCLVVDWLCKWLPRGCFMVTVNLWSKQLEFLSWLSDTIYDPLFIRDLMSQWQWTCKFWAGRFSEFKPLANSSLRF